MAEGAKGMPFERRFTRPGEDGAQGLRFERRDVRIRDAAGDVVFAADGVEVPAPWSQLATDILASKYLHQPSGETSAKEAVARIVNTIVDVGRERGVLAEDGGTYAAELTSILLGQRAAFNSPVWFNLGITEGDGTRSADGQHVFEDGVAKHVPDAYSRPQVSACFIQGLEDSLTGPRGIFDLLRREAHIFRHGSGTGTNFSVLRSRHEQIARGGTSSGVLSFLRVFDAAAGATKSGGTTRRAAKMVVLDADHPEVIAFVDWKRREEEKAQALIAAGYASDWEGEAYASVSGQNGNNSVRVPDAFMRAVLEGGPWQTRLRKDGTVCETFPARRLWKAISEAAWACGDPGLQFADTIASWHTCPSSGPIRATNPCSEFVFLDDTACNLASINLLAYWDDGRFDIEALQHTVRILITAMDLLVDHAGYPTPEIAQNSVRFRPLGLGFANLGAMAMAAGWPYDSDDARGMAAAVASLLAGTAYATSAELAQMRGPFEGIHDRTASAPPSTAGPSAASTGPAPTAVSSWRPAPSGPEAGTTAPRTPSPPTNLDAMQQVMHRHLEAARRIVERGSPREDVPARVEGDWRRVARAGLDAWEAAAKAGTWRNAQVTVIAPTGTIGLLMDCDTTGIEPELRLHKRKRLSGGGSARLRNRTIVRALGNLGYGPEAEEILEHIAATGTVEGSGLGDEHLPVFDTAFPTAPGGRAIRPEGHVLMMAAVQPLLSGGISKTVNLPHDARPQDVADVYLLAWRLGVKSIAVYRDGSKASQPLTGESAGDAPPCPVCRHPTERTGTCFRCANCGTVLGCS